MTYQQKKNISSQKTTNTLRDDGNIEHPELLTMIFIFLSRFFPNSMWSSCLLLTLHNMSHLSLKLRFYIYPINNSWQLFLEVYFPLIYDFIAFHKNQNSAISEIHQFKMTRKEFSHQCCRRSQQGLHRPPHQEAPWSATQSTLKEWY